MLVHEKRRYLYTSIVFGYLLISFAGMWNRNYINWQALAAKERSIALKLHRSAEASNYSIFFILDQLTIAHSDEYPDCIRSVQLQDAFHDKKRFGVRVVWTSDQALPLPPPLPATASTSAIENAIRATTLPYFFDEIDYYGGQALLLIRPGPEGRNPLFMGLRYLGYKYLPILQTGGFDAFLEQITDVGIYDVRRTRNSIPSL